MPSTALQETAPEAVEVSLEPQESPAHSLAFDADAGFAHLQSLIDQMSAQGAPAIRCSPRLLRSLREGHNSRQLQEQSRNSGAATSSWFASFGLDSIPRSLRPGRGLLQILNGLY